MPFEDGLGIGHSGGFNGIVVPGQEGEANFDALEVNPFETQAAARGEVRSLLNKLPQNSASTLQLCWQPGSAVRAKRKQTRTLMLSQWTSPRSSGTRQGENGVSLEIPQETAEGNVIDEKKLKAGRSGRKRT